MTDGQRAFEAGQYDDARAIWTALAEHGEANAALALGTMYDLGRGSPPDASTALHWYREAARGGIADAELNVGVMLDSGRGAPRDVYAAATWYARAAAHGNRRAQYVLGQLYEDGDGVPQNRDLATAWFAAAAVSGLQAASSRLEQLRSTAAASVKPNSPLQPATLVAPEADAVIAHHDGGGTVELVWTAPQQPTPTTFYVEVLSLSAGGSEPAFAQYVSTSSTLMPLRGLQGRFACRVYVVDVPARTYAVSSWRRFAVAPSSLASR